jgi:hypothetical protein
LEVTWEVKHVVGQKTRSVRSYVESEAWVQRVASDSEAKAQIAPSGMMKKRKDGFNMFSLLSGSCSSLLVVV